jgi:hypothetical protein
MSPDAFDEVDWPHVHRTLHEEVSRLFQVWACKQVMNIAATNKNLSRRHRDGRSDKCPCCTIHVETAEHILLCPEVGRVEAFQLCTTALERWLDKADTNPDLTDSIVEYVRRRGTITMEEAIRDAPPRFRDMAVSQDTIGWRRFLRGDDINGDNKHSTAIYCCQWVTYEPGQMVHRIDYPVAGDYARAVALPELHCA